MIIRSKDKVRLGGKNKPVNDGTILSYLPTLTVPLQKLLSVRSE